MQTKEKVKMCPFCEGSMPMDATECTYCGSSLLKVRKAKLTYPAAEESLASLYEPPYSPNRRLVTPAVEQEEILPPPRKEEREEAVREETNEAAKESLKEEGLGALLLLSLGGQLFTLSWLLFFFSHHGRLILEWKSRYWMIYLGIGMLFLYQGYKKLKKV
jgi:ribosomal protein L40E